MQHLGKIAGISIVCATAIQASGYKIPEQSLNATALGAANIAAVKDADASYYNPANMVWMDDGYHFEAGLTYINLPKVKFDGLDASRSGKSKTENFLAPTGHLVTKEYYKDWRFGFSLSAPGGLSKRWQTPYAKGFAEEFTLKIIEANPTAAYKINDKLAIGFGGRAIYTDGVVKSDNKGLISRDLTGDSFDYGYNLALAYRPTSDIKLAATYRSKVDLTITGDAKLKFPAEKPSDGGASVTVPLPAVLALAAAYTFDKTTLEFVYERVYWSKYENLDFNYVGSLDPGMKNTFDTPKDKNWKDTSTYRLGITHEYSDKLTLMAGYAYDKSPAPDSTLGFELPDSDANIYSAGFKYKINNDVSLGLAYLYSDKKSRDINNKNIQGKFSGSGAHLVTAGLTYRF